MINSLLQSLYAPDFVISGRNALAYYQLCSFDFNVECLEDNTIVDLYPNNDVWDHLIFVNESPEITVVNGEDGVRYAPLAKAFVDFLEYPYDDSVLDDIFELIEDNDFKDVLTYIKEHDKMNLIETYQEFFNGRHSL